MIKLSELKTKTFEFYAVLENNEYLYFETTNKLAFVYGYSEEDFIKVSLMVDEEIDTNKHPNIYNGVLCGYYDYGTNELSYLYNSLHQTSMCFYEGMDGHRIKGLFVTLKLKEIK